MSTISVSNIVTANGTEQLVLSTGNTSAGDITILPAGGLVLAPNSSINAIVIATGSTDNTLVINASGIVVSSNLNVDSGTLFVDNVNNRVGIGNTAPAVTLQVTGTMNITGSMNVSSNTINLGSSTSAANGFTYLPNGIKMVWGVQSASVNTTTTATATFISAFTTIYSFSGIVLGQSTGVVTSVNTTSLVWRNSSAVAAAANTFYFTAIGV